MAKQFRPAGQPPPPSHPSNPPQCPFHDLFVQQLFFLGASCSCSPDVLHGTSWKSLIYAKDENRSCWRWRVGSKQSLNLQSLLPLFSVSWCVQKTKGMIDSQFEPTKQKSRLTVASVKCKIFYYEVVINVWRDKGCTLALMKRSVNPSTQNSHEQGLFLQLAMAVVYWGFLQ